MKKNDRDYGIFYDDALAYLQWGIKNKRSPSELLNTLIHDISGVARQERCFLPRVSGWAKAKRAVDNEIK